MSHEELPERRHALIIAPGSYRHATKFVRALEAGTEDLDFLINMSAGSGKSFNYALLDFAQYKVRNRLLAAGEELRNAATQGEKRAAVREYLAALADLILCLLRFLVSAVWLLLSLLMSHADAGLAVFWKPPPIDAAPQIAPRGPNSPFPVLTYRGGHHRSALGSAVLAA
ncbi:hypothetical protein [Streptomyces sp. NPDC050546]|uniref:hypothetical protein n=1 Tax=Streptomyces sp. NPDC050546 TaxID=3365628 RepID=UPI0037A91375